MRRAVVGRELDRDATLVERDCERFRRKQMAAGAAGREQDERRAARRHQTRLPATARSGAIIAARGCSRVSASSMPIA